MQEENQDKKDNKPTQEVGVKERENKPRWRERVTVIAPDEAAGEDFQKTLETEGLKTDLQVGLTPARVVAGEGGGGNKTTDDPEGVAKALARQINQAVELAGEDDGIPIVTISCNTESLPFFADRAQRLAAKRKGRPLVNGIDYLLVTPLTAMRDRFERADDKPVVLGTQVMAGEAEKYGFESPGSKGLGELQDLTQELIWRVKAVVGSDTATAPEYPDLEDKKTLLNQGIELFRCLKERGINNIALMCTELPILYRMMQAEGLLKRIDPKGEMRFIDPAVMVAEVVKETLKDNR